MKLKDRIACWGYGLVARREGLWHLIRGHRVHWRDHGDIWCGCTGDIWCEACPDCEGRDLSIWCRNNSVLARFMKAVCSWVGHPGWSHPTRALPPDYETNVAVLDEVCCTRCLEWVSLPKQTEAQR